MKIKCLEERIKLAMQRNVNKFDFCERKKTNFFKHFNY